MQQSVKWFPNKTQLKSSFWGFIILLFNVDCAAQENTLFCPSAKEELVMHSHYWLSYSEQHEQAHWVFYELTREEAIGSFARTDNFRSDPSVSTGSAPLHYYVGSGFDRGHLAPAGDMGFSEEAINESFYMSNMCPQHPSFNRGTWKKLETLVRNWAIQDGNLYIVTGGVLSDDLPFVANTSLSIPELYYKLVLDWDADELRSIAFLLPNRKCSGDLRSYQVSIDSLETLTNIDFFAALPDQVETLFESETTGLWDFEVEEPTSQKPSRTTETDFCQGQTLEGKPCTRKTKNESGFCHQHQKDENTAIETPLTSPNSNETMAIQCLAKTQKGKQCKHKTTNASSICWQHEK